MLIVTASSIARLVAAQSEGTCLWEGKWYRKEPKMGSENSEFQATVCASGRERIGIRKSRLGGAKRSVHFIHGTDCVRNRKINNQCCWTGPTLAKQPRPINESVCC